MAEYVLHEDRFFDPDQEVRKNAREIYNSIKDLPIISPHGHVDPKLFAENKAFPNPTELILIPDHYLFRMLYSQGISLESLGIPTTDGTEVEKDPRKIWQLFADNYYLFNGTPSGVWLDYEFNIVLLNFFHAHFMKNSGLKLFLLLMRLQIRSDTIRR
jgi:glucuronate isomerase